MVNSATGATTIPSLEIYIPIGLVLRDKSVPVEFHTTLPSCILAIVFAYIVTAVPEFGSLVISGSGFHVCVSSRIIAV